MVGSTSGPCSTFKAFLGSARVRVPLSNKTRVRVGSVQHIYGSLQVRVRIFGPVKTSSPQSPDLNPIEHLWDVVEWDICIMDKQPTNMQQLRDAIMSIWIKISEECFQHLVQSMPRRIKAVLKAKGGPNRY